MRHKTDTTRPDTSWTDADLDRLAEDWEANESRKPREDRKSLRRMQRTLREVAKLGWLNDN